MASDIREKIIDASWELFHEKGFGETTIRCLRYSIANMKGSGMKNLKE